MTKEEIVKSLRACGNNTCNDCCVHFRLGLPCSAKNFGAADLIEQQAARIAELEAKVPRWIPVTEEIPPDQEEVLVLTRSSFVTLQENTVSGLINRASGYRARR